MQLFIGFLIGACVQAVFTILFTLWQDWTERKGKQT